MTKDQKQQQWAPGDVVVLLGLPKQIKTPHGEKMGPKIAKLVRRLDDGRWFVRLFQVSPFRHSLNRHAHFAPQGRVVDHQSIERRATGRELALGCVIAFEITRAA